MKKIEYIQDWHDNKCTMIMYVDNETIIGSICLNEEYNNLVINSLYIIPSRRNEGISHLLLTDILSICDNNEVWLQVKRDNFIINTYIKYGFKYMYADDDDDNYLWYMKK